MDVATAQSAWDKLRTAAKKDPKKAGALVVLVAVMGGMWAKVLLKPTPAPAGAATVAPAGPAAPAKPATAGALPAPSSDKARVGSRMRTAAWSTDKLAPATRNLFLVEYDRYQLAGKSTTPGTPVQQSGSSDGDQAKSGPSLADLKKERKILADNLQSQAAQLKLQTTVMGPSPKALVNGSLVGEGDVVASFRIVKITNRGMVIEREGIRLDVQMK